MLHVVRWLWIPLAVIVVVIAVVVAADQPSFRGRLPATEECEGAKPPKCSQGCTLSPTGKTCEVRRPLLSWLWPW
jgi:hypothetical protein